MKVYSLVLALGSLETASAWDPPGGQPDLIGRMVI